jgi:hypothetical protein
VISYWIKTKVGLGSIIVTVILLNHGFCGDPRTELLEFLNKASKSNDTLSGKVEEFELPDTNIAAGSLPLKAEKTTSSARFHKQGENILFETSGNVELSNVGVDSRFNNIADVIVFSEDQVFSFLPLGSGADPFANLHIYRPKDVPHLRRRIDNSLVFVLASAYQVSGLSVASAVISPDAKVSGDLQTGLSLHVISKSPVKNELKYNVKASEGKFSTFAILDTQLGESGSIVYEVRSEGLWNGHSAIPDIVVKRVSGATFGNPVVNQYKVGVEPSDEKIKFPIDKLFFKRYERDYTVSNGEKLTGEIIEAVPENIRGLGMKRFATDRNPLRRGYGYTIAAGVLFSLLAIFSTFWILKKGRMR